MGNYIKIDRKILDWEWYTNINTKVLFLHMLLKANWKDERFEGKVIPRGSFVSSVNKLSEETQLTVQEIRTALNHLKSTNEITSKATNKYTEFTVNNYNLYQFSNNQENKQTTSKQQTINKQSTTIEEKEEIKEGNKGIYKQITDLYNNICVSFSKVTRLSENRKKAISARLKMYDIDDFKRLFEMAEQSNFLKGGNDRNWTANFDWLIKDSNMAKVLDGNYANSSDKPQRPKNARKFKEREYDYNNLEKQMRQKQNKQIKELLEKDRKENQ